MTMNNELFKRLQKAEIASIRSADENTAKMNLVDETEMKRNAFDAAAVLHLFLPGLTMIER